MNQRGFVMPSPLMLVGGVALAFGISTLLFWRLYNGAIDDLATYRAQVEAAQEQVRLENERKHQELMAVNVRLESGWSNALDELRARPALIRVRPNSCPGAVPSVPTPTAVPNEAAPVDTISAEQCAAFLHDGIQDAAQVMWLQDWIKQAVEATK